MSEEVTLPEVGSEWLYEGLHSEPQLVKVLGVRTIIEWFYVDSHLTPAKVYQADNTAWGKSFKRAPFKPEVGKTYVIKGHFSNPYEFLVWEILGNLVYGRERNLDDNPDDTDSWYATDYSLERFEELVKNGKA